MNRKFFVILAFGLAAAAGCARSAAYKQDSEYYQSEPRSYYSQPGVGATPTERIEMLGQPKKKVVVFNLWNDTPMQGGELEAYAADELRRALFMTERVIIPTDLQEKLETRNYVQGDKVKVAQLVREGRRLGVAVVVIGRISKIAFRQRGDDVGLFRQAQSLAGVDIELKVFDVHAGREIMAIGRSGEASANALVAFEEDEVKNAEYRAELSRMAIRDAMGGAVNPIVKAIEKTTWEGRVAKLTGKRVYVNAGRGSGIVTGDILRVLTPGDDVYDPLSGAFLGRTPGQLKGTLEVVDYIGEDGAIANVHTGGNFKEGDVVRLY